MNKMMIGFALVLGAVLAAGGLSFAQGVERSASSRSGVGLAGQAPNQLYPTCGPNQYLWADGKKFSCRDFPACNSNQALTFNGTNLTCTAIHRL